MATPTDGKIQEITVQKHNEYRRNHKTPELIWNSNLATDAQKWAEHLIATGRLQHSNINEQGENLFTQWSSGDLDVTAACKKAVEKWYSEVEKYNFSSPGFTGGSGHFTQVVWKASTQLGVGCAKAPKNGGTEVIVVARYQPRGNVLRQFQDNVLPPGQ